MKCRVRMTMSPGRRWMPSRDRSRIATPITTTVMPIPITKLPNCQRKPDPESSAPRKRPGHADVGFQGSPVTLYLFPHDVLGPSDRPRGPSGQTRIGYDNEPALSAVEEVTETSDRPGSSRARRVRRSPIAVPAMARLGPIGVPGKSDKRSDRESRDEAANRALARRLILPRHDVDLPLRVPRQDGDVERVISRGRM